MSDPRWARVKKLFQAAIERPPGERQVFLAAAAADDESLRGEVEALLALDAEESDFLDAISLDAGPVDSPASSRLSTERADSDPVLSIGQRVGVYEILALLGAGAMGEVYRTRDTRLNREVALKILPPLFARSRERIARFRREAQLLAALNHPNIAAIYGLEESSVVSALVLELVEGPTLGALIARGRIPPVDAWPIARQIAEALEAAHGQSIVHRDLKPSNVHVRPDGVVKVLDFGLAKALAADGSAHAADAPANPQRSKLPATREGIILGTAAYMAPEQARGLPVDERADIWSFGCVLFEMLTGSPAFRGDTVSDLLAAVIKDDPDWSALPRELPPAIVTLLRRCLRKDPRQRLQAIGDARIEIEEFERNPQGVISENEGLGRRERAGWIAAAVVLASLAAAGLIGAMRPRPTPPESRLDISTPPTTDPASMALSPDGQKLVFSATGADGRPHLWIRYLTDVVPRPLPSTYAARHPFWSPDSLSIGFFADGRLKRVDAEGGSLREIADAPLGLGGTWNSGDIIVFSPNWVGPLMRVSAGGGQPAAVTRLTQRQTGHRFPKFLPDGRHFLFETIEGGGISGVVYLGDLQAPDAARLIDSGAGATYAASGHVVFARGAPAAATLMAQAFDPDRLALAGDPFPIAATIAAGLDPGSAALSVSAAGPIAYRPDSGPAERQFVWFDRAGKQIAKLGEADGATPLNPALSPDGRHVAVRRSVGENTDIWLLDVGTGLLGRLTASGGLHNFPVWSPDSRDVAFTANFNRGGVNDFYRKSVDGSGGEEPLLATAQNKGLADWSSDGRYLLFRSVDPKTGNDLWAVSLTERHPFPVVQTDFDERDGQFSPDGRWIAYQSNETGSFEIWARPFPGPGQHVRISHDGGTQVRWGRDGKELFYIALDGRLMAVPLAFDGDRRVLQPGAPVALFATRIGGAFQGFNRHQYVVAADGQRFLMNTVNEEAASTVTIIQNWRPR